MASVTLTSLIARVRERADMTGSSFVADAATGLYAWINEANAKLNGMLVDAMGEEYVSKTAAVTIVAGTSDYALPSDFYKLYGVDMTIGTYTQALVPYMRRERNTYRNSTAGSMGSRQTYRLLYGLDVPHYAIVGSNFRLYPTPQQVVTTTILYAPEAPILAAGSDTVAYPNGWERFIVLDAAIQALLKEESSVTALVAEREKIIAEIALAKEQRDLAAPHRVTELASLDADPLW